MIALFPLIECCQTIVHEMCHAWQCHYGSPSRKGYHNKEWADMMESIGLMPSHSGKPGGKRTGQTMGDYPINGGKFMGVTEQLMNEEVFEGLFLEINPDISQLIKPDKPLFEQVQHLILEAEPKPKPSRSKVKYQCSCSTVWGKPGLSITCNVCSQGIGTV